MNYQYLLDTNIISDLVKNPDGIISQKIVEQGGEKVCTSVIVASELYFGAEKKNSSHLKKQLDVILEQIPVLPLTPPVERYYAKARTELEMKGTPISPNDLLIASHGLVLGLTVVTANIREFSRVSGLSVENWLSSDN